MNHHFTRTAAGAVTALCLLLLTLATVSAQTSAAGTFRGEIEKTGSSPTVLVDGQERTLTAGPNVQIQRGDKTVNFADLKKGDAVTVTTNPDGSVARLEAIPVDDGGSWFKWWYLLPLLLLLLLPLLMRRKKTDDFVVERKQGVVGATPTTDRGRTTGER